MSYARKGMGDYDRVGNWGWEFDPPPYNFLAPADAAPQPAPRLLNNRIVRGMGAYEPQAYVTPQALEAPMASAAIRIPDAWGRVQLPCPVVLTPQASGLGGCGCGCKGAAGGCGGDGHSHGLGLFESGFDYTQWGYPEWGFVAIGGYLTLSVMGDLFTVGRATRSGYQRAAKPFKRRAARRRALARLEEAES